MAATRPNHHGASAAADSKRGPSFAVLIEGPACAIWVAETRESPMTFEARESGRLARFDAPKKCLEGQVKSLQRLLKRVRPQCHELGAIRAQLGHVFFLVIPAYRLPGLSVSLNALLQGSVIQLTVESQPLQQPSLLRGARVQLEGGFSAFQLRFSPLSTTSESLARRHATDGPLEVTR